MQGFLSISFATERCIPIISGKNSLWYLSKKDLENITLFKKLLIMKYYYTINEYRIEMK